LTLGSPAAATVTIVDDDPAPPPPSAGQVAFAAATSSALESAGTVTLNVTRSGGSAGAVTVAYATMAGTATSGTDFTAASGTLSWADGQAGSRSIVVAVNNDTTDESDETFTVTLSGATGGLTLGSPAAATVTIVDDDPAPPPPSAAAGGGGSTGWPALALLALGVLQRRRLRAKL
jgi:hypothetical protein